ncbi:MAG TPA: hypothetical protein VJ783_13425 [Pirellulales bacterium]|nr:hypothetical protein [Pirellulales bacterium]
MFHRRARKILSRCLAAVAAIQLRCGAVSRPPHRWAVVWAVVVLGVIGPQIAAADEPAAPASVDAREAIDRVAAGYQLFLGPDRLPLEMQKEPVLRWPNPTRETPEGATFVWTHQGRPEAIACIWDHGILSHAFHSLSTSELVAKHNGQTIWHPAAAGIEPAPLAGAPVPADSAAKLLRQMKDLARRFTCRLTGDAGGEQLRLLPRPLYRYQTKRDNLIDGALFAFVQGTDPEVVLVLEATRHNGKSEWRYALTRRSMAALEADLDGKPIWSVSANGGAPGDVWFHGGIVAASSGQ